jgi:hypothetical protein
MLQVEGGEALRAPPVGNDPTISAPHTVRETPLGAPMLPGCGNVGGGTQKRSPRIRPDQRKDERMSDPVIAAAFASMARSAPGNPLDVDDGHPGSMHVRIRSIPHLPTARLVRRVAHLNAILDSPDGMHAFDDGRRALVHLGVHRMAIVHELNMRGVAP